MRNPARIKRLMRLVGLIWEKCPDVRFNQLIDSLQWEYTNKHNAYKEELWKKVEYRGIVSFEKRDITDLFYVEDEPFIEFLEEKVKELWT